MAKRKWKKQKIKEITYEIGFDADEIYVIDIDGDLVPMSETFGKKGEDWAKGGRLGLDNSGQKIVQKLYKKGGKV